jgi:hypothetical protein
MLVTIYSCVSTSEGRDAATEPEALKQLFDLAQRPLNGDGELS